MYSSNIAHANARHPQKDTTMALTMHQCSVRLFLRHLRGLAACMAKTKALYQEKKYDESSLINYRLFPDMFDFARQVRMTTIHARQCTELLSGVEGPKFEDNEKSLDDLIARVQTTMDYLGAIKAEQIDGTEEKSVTVKLGSREATFTGTDLLLKRSLPNFYFHVTTAYNIMRHNGVDVGKGDFMGSS
jgi:uncharacterized protein